MTRAMIHVSLKGWDLRHARGAPKPTGVGGCSKAKGKERSVGVNEDSSTFVRALLVPTEVGGDGFLGEELIV